MFGEMNWRMLVGGSITAWGLGTAAALAAAAAAAAATAAALAAVAPEAATAWARAGWTLTATGVDDKENVNEYF